VYLLQGKALVLAKCLFDMLSGMDTSLVDLPDFTVRQELVCLQLLIKHYLLLSNSEERTLAVAP